MKQSAGVLVGLQAGDQEDAEGKVLETILTTSQEVLCAVLDLAGVSLPEVLLARRFSDPSSACPASAATRPFGDACPELMQPQQGVRRSKFITTKPFCAAATPTRPAFLFIAHPQVESHPNTAWSALNISSFA